MKKDPMISIPAELLADYDRLKMRCEALEAENNRLRAENNRLCVENAALRATVARLEETAARLESKIEEMSYGIKKARQRTYGSSSETLASLALEEDDEGEEDDSPAPVTADRSLGARVSPRRKPGRRPLPEDLPREERRYELPPHARRCETCGGEKGCIGETRSEQLEYVPAVLKVLVHVRCKYACRGCASGVVTAPIPAQPLPKSRASPGLLAYILVSKFQDHLPFYRQEQIAERLGFPLSRGTACQWLVKCAALLRPLYAALVKAVVASDYVQADESTLQVLSEPGRPPQSTSYAWVYKTGFGVPCVIVFEYQPTRAQSGPEALLKDFAGYLQTDGYAGYNGLRQKETIIAAGCWSHLRRKFADIVKLVKRPGKAVQALEMIAALYAIEKHAREQGLSPPEVYALRQDKAKPIVEAFKVFLDAQADRVLPQSPLGKAVRYGLTQWPTLTAYLTDGRLQIDNNAVENVIRPLALGRKNWLFTETVAGAEASMILYSLIETCKANGVEPFDYLRTVLTLLPLRDPKADISDLLPYALPLAEYKMAA
jgi:transposase